MSKRGESSELAPPSTQRVGGESSHHGFFLILTKTNYKVWATRMKLHLQGLDLWGVVEADNAPMQKDRHVMSMMFNVISDEIVEELDEDKTAKETWNILKVKNGFVPLLPKAMVQSPKREFDGLFVENDELISN